MLACLHARAPVHTHKHVIYRRLDSAHTRPAPAASGREPHRPPSALRNGQHLEAAERYLKLQARGEQGAQRPAPCGPQRAARQQPVRPKAAARPRACAEAEGRTPGACAIGAPTRPHPQFQARGRVRKFVRAALPLALIRYKPLPFPQTVSRRLLTEREACRGRKCGPALFCFRGIFYSLRDAGLPGIPLSL